MSGRFWAVVYSDVDDGIRGVAGKATGGSAADLRHLLSHEADLCEVLLDDLGDDLAEGLWIIAGTATDHGDDGVFYGMSSDSPAPRWRRLLPSEAEAIAIGKTPRAMELWLAGGAWAE